MISRISWMREGGNSWRLKNPEENVQNRTWFQGQVRPYRISHELKLLNRSHERGHESSQFHQSLSESPISLTSYRPSFLNISSVLIVGSPQCAELHRLKHSSGSHCRWKGTLSVLFINCGSLTEKKVQFVPFLLEPSVRVKPDIFCESMIRFGRNYHIMEGSTSITRCFSPPLLSVFYWLQLIVSFSGSFIRDDFNSDISGIEFWWINRYYHEWSSL